jgi:hypothetical protein
MEQQTDKILAPVPAVIVLLSTSLASILDKLITKTLGKTHFFGHTKFAVVKHINNTTIIIYRINRSRVRKNITSLNYAHTRKTKSTLVSASAAVTLMENVAYIEDGIKYVPLFWIRLT